MKKNELLKELKEAIKTEESASLIYFQHLRAISLRFNIDHPFKVKFQQTLNYLIEQNDRHKRICENLYQEVEKDKRDDF